MMVNRRCSFSANLSDIESHLEVVKVLAENIVRHPLIKHSTRKKQHVSKERLSEKRYFCQFVVKECF